MKLSIVTTLYYSAPYIEEFYNRISACAQKITDDYEIIFVNDGSPDNSLNVALDLYNKDNKVKVINLSRNFGHHKAIITGFDHTNGEYVFFIDSDLEEPPELLLEFWEEMGKEENIDVVYGVQKQRKGEFCERVLGGWFYKIFNMFSYIKLTESTLITRLMTRQYVQALIQCREESYFIPGIMSYIGFNQKPLYVKKSLKGCTTYSFRKRLKLAIDSITSFSSMPLVYVFVLGVFIMFIAMFFIVILLVKKIMFGVPIQGWTSVMLSLWFLGGVTVFSIGLVGIYISRIFKQVKNRSFTIIKNFYTRN